MARQKEYDLQLALTNYLAVNYPKVQFRSDLGGVRLPIGLAAKVQRIQKSRAWPDLQICRVRTVSPAWHAGLFLELKTSKDDVFVKDRSRLLKGAASHVLEQCAMLCILRSKGYAAELVFGFDEARSTIDTYLNDKATFFYSENVRNVVWAADDIQWTKARLESPVDLSILEERYGGRDGSFG